MGIEALTHRDDGIEVAIPNSKKHGRSGSAPDVLAIGCFKTRLLTGCNFTGKNGVYPEVCT